jgi:3-oxoacyl-[acyl-carrier-protein] synthase III
VTHYQFPPTARRRAAEDEHPNTVATAALERALADARVKPEDPKLR